MQLILVLTVLFIKVRLVHFRKVVEIVRTLRVHAFVDDKVFAVLLVNKGMAAMRTLEMKGTEGIPGFL